MRSDGYESAPCTNFSTCVKVSSFWNENLETGDSMLKNKQQEKAFKRRNPF